MGSKLHSKKKKNLNKKGINPGIIVLVFSILFFVFLIYLHNNPGLFTKPIDNQEKYVLVANADEGTERYFDLNQDQLIAEDGYIGKVIIEIANKRVRVKESSCPKQTCVKSGWISSIGETIICAPNKIILKIRGSKKTVVPELYNN
ncbi:MAG: NusG domain II-containing protein [Caldisericia bacterium]|nr:NusG domain II-containing protein [Caldisericia bacterium]